MLCLLFLPDFNADIFYFSKLQESHKRDREGEKRTTLRTPYFQIIFVTGFAAVVQIMPLLLLHFWSARVQVVVLKSLSS
jgi:hypothetical protein